MLATTTRNTRTTAGSGAPKTGTLLAHVWVVVSLLHQALVRLFDECPELLRSLLRHRVAIPGRSEFRTTSLDVTDLIPTERRADGALFVE